MSGPTMFAQSAHPDTFSSMPPASCPQCGSHVDTPELAHRRIEELETQVRMLNSKAAMAVDKLADYEDEVRSLRAQCARLQQQSHPPAERPQSPLQNNHNNNSGSNTGVNTSQLTPPRTASRLASLSSLLPGRRKEITSISSALPSPAIWSPFALSTPNLYSPVPPSEISPPNSSGNIQAPAVQDRHQSLSLQTLQSSLETERSLRMRAESSLTQTQTELEELTAQLFGQANEMVATERKARHKLEERVKLLETRDSEKRKRLDRLETALQRIDRVRGLVESKPMDQSNPGIAMGMDMDTEMSTARNKATAASPSDPRHKNTNINDIQIHIDPATEISEQNQPRTQNFDVTS